MSFTSEVKGREMAYIMRILEVFGVVEQQQMRRLFSHLGDEAYGKILSRLHKEGQVYWARDGVRLAASRLTMERTDFESSMLCFWVFIKLKDSIRDFCSGESPTLVTLTTKERIIDLIPVTANNAEEINRYMNEIPEETKRVLVLNEPRLIAGINWRDKNDFVLQVDSRGDIEIYKR